LIVFGLFLGPFLSRFGFVFISIQYYYPGYATLAETYSNGPLGERKPPKERWLASVLRCFRLRHTSEKGTSHSHSSKHSLELHRSSRSSTASNPVRTSKLASLKLTPPFPNQRRH